MIMATPREHAPDVTARFSDLEHARAAIEALENSGVDGDDIELLGPVADHAVAEPRQSDADRRAVSHVLWRVTRAGAVWGAAGALAGGGIGALILWAGGALDAPVWLLPSALVGGFLASTVAAMIGAERSTSDSDAWTLTFEEDDADGPVWVAVRATSPHVVEKARRALERGAPIDVRVRPVER
jgi:hypothetical protein